MGWFSFLRKKPTVAAIRYDAAQTSAENAQHWSLADGMSADSSNSPGARKRIRDRARYEVANNSYATGMVETLSGDVIGTGPRLQLSGAHEVETAWEQWADSVLLAEKLKTLARAKIVDGEAFALLITNKRLNRITLDLQPIEAERITADYAGYDWQSRTDGIELDKAGNPVSYDVLNHHPGGANPDYTYTKVAASNIVHWFRHDRPEQHRGLSELTPALPLFAQLRRYTLAVIAAAETAADYAAVLYTDSPAGGESVAAVPFKNISLSKRAAVTLPDGWKLGQIKAEQPVTNYPQFKREILGEIGRALSVPVNIVTGDSSQHNYASGRLDHQVYHRAVALTQKHCERAVLAPIFSAWWAEYSKLAGVAAPIGTPRWYWDGFEHVDPSKEANAQKIRLGSLTATLAEEYARSGKDWEEELKQIARERKMMAELGISFAEIPLETIETEKGAEKTEEE